MEWFKSMRFQLVFGFMCVLMMLIAFLLYNNYYAIHVVRTQVSKESNVYLSNYMKDMDHSMQEIDNYLYSLTYADPDISLLNLANGSSDYYFAYQRLTAKIKTEIDLSKYIYSIFIYSKSNDSDVIISMKASTSTLINQVDAGVKQAFAAKARDAVTWDIVYLDTVPYLIRFVSISQNQYVGALIALNDLVGSLELWDNSKNQGAIMYSDQWIALTPDNPISQTSLSRYRTILSEQHLPFYIFTNADTKKKYLVQMFFSANSHLVMLYLLPEDSLLQNLPYFQTVIYLIPLAALLILFFYIGWLQRFILKPLTKLMLGMKSISRGDFDIRLEGKANPSEISVINQTFNRMISELQALKIGVYEEKLKTQEARFKQLQSQINPHFYMNSLNVIHSLAELQEYSLVKKMVRLLVDYFRFVVYHNPEQVTLAEEFKHIETYLEIQKLRYPDTLMYTILLPDQLKMVPIPPLVIQPFVENCLLHGFKDEHPFDKIKVKICVELAEDANMKTIILTVADNGKGFTAEALHYFEKLDRHENSWSGHVGIWNVYQRIKLVYRDQAKLTFTNQDEGGAKVTIQIPINES